MNTLLLFDCFVAFILLCLVFIVWIKNRQLLVNRLFCYSIAAFAAWVISNYFSNAQQLSVGVVRVANHLVLFFSGIAFTYLYRFTLYSTAAIGKSSIIKFKNRIYILGLGSSFVCLSPLVVQSISRQGDVYAINFGPLAFLYFISLLVHAFLIVYSLIYSVRKSRGVEKARVVIILWSVMISIFLAIFTNALLPYLTGWFGLTNLGPFAAIIMASGIAYAIIKHRLFDIKAVIARSLGYLLSVFVLGAVYALVSFVLISKSFFENKNVSTSQEVVYTALAVFLSISFHSLLQFFNKITSKTFYREGYDSQEVLDKLGKIIVGNVNPRKICTDSLDILGSALNPARAVIILGNKKNDDLEEVFLNNENGVSLSDDFVEKLKNKVFPIIRDDIQHEDGKMSQLFDKYGLDMIFNLKSHNENIGYMLIGPKKSGSIYTSSDVSMLGIVADELAVALQNAVRFQEIASFNETLQKKIDDATGELRRSNQKLKALDEAKDEFISMASHQLRTPLTSVKGYVSMVLDGDAGKLTPVQEQLLEQAFTSSQRMVYLIADLLNVSRLRTGKFVIEAKPTYLPSVIEGEVAQLKETAQGRQLQLMYTKPSKFPTLMLDETKIRQVIMNFIDNAIYYTPPGGHIIVKLEETPKAIQYTVTDDGIGVPKHEQHHLFTKFYRAGNARKARPDGTGLGLFMAKKVIIAQGGAIICNSVEGKGSTFGFTFPKAKLVTKEQAVSEL